MAHSDLKWTTPPPQFVTVFQCFSFEKALLLLMLIKAVLKPADICNKPDTALRV